MTSRKLHLYGDADLEPELENWLREQKHTSYVGVRELGTQSQPDSFHFREAAQMEKVLVTYDDGYLDDTVHSIQQTIGVIVIGRSQDQGWIMSAAVFHAFLREAWPTFRETARQGLGMTKIRATRNGYQVRRRTSIDVQDDYVAFKRV